MTGIPDGPTPDPDTRPDEDSGRGSLRRSQWLPTQHEGPAKADAADGRATDGAVDRMPRRLRLWVPLATVAVTLLLVTGFAISSGASPHSGRPAAAARSTASRSGSGALVPLSDLASASVNPSLTGSPSASASVVPPPPAAASPHAASGASAGSAANPASTGSALPQPIGWWPLNDGSGTTAVDKVGHHNGVTTNTNWIGAAADFNGTNSVITVPEPVVDTGPGKSFTIAAWVYLRTASAFSTVVSQDGSVNAGFYLEYSGADNRWAFARQSTDTTSTTPHRALSSAPPALNTWTPLVGVFDGTTDELTLYVNGQLQGAAVDPTPFATHGSLVFGRSIAGGGYGAWLPGTVGDIRVYNTALTNAQIQAIGEYL